jgi:hypothetical protein
MFTLIRTMAALFDAVGEARWKSLQGVRVTGEVLRSLHPRAAASGRVSSASVATVPTAAPQPEPTKPKSRKPKNKSKSKSNQPQQQQQQQQFDLVEEVIIAAPIAGNGGKPPALDLVEPEEPGYAAIPPKPRSKYLDDDDDYDYGFTGPTPRP